MRKLHLNTNKKFIVIAVILLIAISIGYATLSTILSINGTANIEASSWNVYFTNIQTTAGSVTPTTIPTTAGTDTTSLTWAVNLAEPGDFYEFTVDVVNGGTINAKIAENGVNKSTLTSNQDTYVNYTVTYSDGTAISAGDTLAKSGQTGSTKTIKVRVNFDSDITAEQLNALTDPMALTLNFSLEYVQD